MHVSATRVKDAGFHSPKDQDANACLDHFPILFVAFLQNTVQLVQSLLGDAAAQVSPDL
jgi:hypothetical protein